MQSGRSTLFQRLHGRDEELNALLAWLRASRLQQSPVTVLVSGDSGVGKTRLIEEVAADAMLASACILRGAATGSVPQPYAPVIEALASGRAPTEVVAALDSPADAPLDSQSDRMRRFALVIDYLRRRASRDGQVCLILEDLHWSDSASLEFLSHLTRMTEDAAIAVIATYRTPDIESSLARASAIVRLSREG